MTRGRAYHRWQKRRTVGRKLGLLRRIGGDEFVSGWTRGSAGRLAKGKIHCSCLMCRTKSCDCIAHRDAKIRASADAHLRLWRESE